MNRDENSRMYGVGDGRRRPRRFGGGVTRGKHGVRRRSDLYKVQESKSDKRKWRSGNVYYKGDGFYESVHSCVWMYVCRMGVNQVEDLRRRRFFRRE